MILVDTNVLLDVLISRQPFVASAAAIWAMVESKQIAACVCATSFTNVYYIVRKFADQERADLAVQSIAKVFEVAPVNTEVIARAIQSNAADFEDAVQMYAALAIGAGEVVTRDVAGFAWGPMVTTTPDQLLARLKSAQG